MAETKEKLGPTNKNLSLFLISVFGLYLELLLIRWVGTEINIFAYLQNTVLVVCFLGLGMGCFTCRQPIKIRKTLGPLLMLTLLLSIPFSREMLRRISLLLSTTGDVVVWDEMLAKSPLETTVAVVAGLLATFALMTLIWEAFVPIGQTLGRLMDDHPKPILAYSINVAGSLLGIWLFVSLSVFFQPPYVWLLIVGALSACFLNVTPDEKKGNAVLIVLIIVASWFSGMDRAYLELLWSPYQKISLMAAPPKIKAFKYNVIVNNFPFQGIADSVDKADWNDPRILYDLPFLLHPNPEKVLIVGTGAGNDVAGALRQDVKQITAVEIDPAVIRLGKKYNPAKPYDSPRVTLINDDARSYFATSKDRYDLILLALLDSHTTNSMTNARLDHYVYTKESLTKAKELLKEDGIMVLTFFAKRFYIADRIGRVLRDVFGEEAIYFRIPQGTLETGGVAFVTGNLNAVRSQLESNGDLRALIDQWKAERPIELSYTTRITVDDWPYLYLRTAHIPLLYYFLGLLLVLLFLCARRRHGMRGQLTTWHRSHWHFFFLGAAFLLLEVQNISKSAVVLGNTWDVNAVIISGILMMILLANTFVERFPNTPIIPVYVCLIASCILLYFVDLAKFGFLPYYQKTMLVGGLTTAPMFFSGIVFIRSFAPEKRKDLALGANLIGALVGGLLQSVTFVTGIKALLLIVAALYMCAVITGPKTLKEADA
ncbi:MAG: spermidine synthase [Candidatus Binatia bacterium]